MAQKVVLRKETWKYKKVHRDAIAGCDGETDYGARVIRVAKGLDGRILLETQIHEALHATIPDLAESAVTMAADDISRYLYKLGWRKP